MVYPAFSKLQYDDNEIFEDNIPPSSLSKVTGRRRARSFTRFEKGLIITLVIFATALAVYTIIYIVQHQGAIRPAAVAALSCVALLLLVVACSIYQRIRRPNWFRDVESGNSNGGEIKKWTISAPIPIAVSPAQTNSTNMSELTLESKTSIYTPVSTTTTATLTSVSSPKGRVLQKRDRSTEKKGGHRLAFWLSSPKRRRADKEYYEHLISSSARSSSEMSEGGYHQPQPEESKRPRSLWRSVFELPGEDPDIINIRSITPELPAGEDVQIVVTRPEPAARTKSLYRGRAHSSGSLDIAALRQSTLAFDPLRSNPFHELKRDPSVRQSKSSHVLGASERDQAAGPVPISVTPPPLLSPRFPSPAPPLRRPRSAEPGPDRARLGYDLATIQLQVDAAVARMESNSRGVRVHQQQQQQQQQSSPRIVQTRPPRLPLPVIPTTPASSLPEKERQQSVSRSRSASRPSQDRGRPSQQGMQQAQHKQQSPNARGLRRSKSPVVDVDSDYEGQDLRKAFMHQVGK